MKLLRFENGSGPKLGVLEGETIISLDGIADQYPTMLSVVEAGQQGLADVAKEVAARKATVPLKDVSLLAPIERPGKFMAIGMNYGKHLAEAVSLGIEAPQHQLWFNKQTTCITGPFDDIDPGVTDKLDYEVELCVVMGKITKGATLENAKDYVFGYTVVNDVSARDWQRHTPTFTIGKSFDTHGPIGPWIVTADELPDPHNLGLRCYVNGEKRQDSNTSYLIHDVWKQISYLSHAFTLEPGDLIATGTPEGVGGAMEPPVYLQPGDVVRCEVDGIGTIENTVVESSIANTIWH